VACRACRASWSHEIVSGLSVSPDVAVIAERVREAKARGTSLRITGAGSWLDAGRLCDARERLDIGALFGITRYEPGDLTLTARAGTPLTEIERATGAEGQWLTLDAHGSPAGTLGATIATASAGPLASAFGTPRDHVLGCEFVSGTGDVVRAGGRVVKNVAGFDLVRLLTGAWGTLGPLTEITVRLRARPEEDRTIAVVIDGATPLQVANAAWSWLRQSEYTPLAAELVSPALATRLSLPGASLLVRLGGNATFVRAASDAVASLGSASLLESSVWSRLSTTEPPRAITLRASTLPSRTSELWSRALAFAERAGGYVHSTITRGIVRCVIPAAADDELTNHLRSGITELAAAYSVVGERLPVALWSAVSRSRSSDALADSVRRAFDPDGIMNRGILGVA
jgi:glycolate oxidase FAD binding subunit